MTVRTPREIDIADLIDSKSPFSLNFLYCCAQALAMNCDMLYIYVILKWWNFFAVHDWLHKFLIYLIYVDTRNDTNDAIQKDYAKTILDGEDCGCNFW